MPCRYKTLPKEGCRGGTVQLLYRGSARAMGELLYHPRTLVQPGIQLLSPITIPSYPPISIDLRIIALISVDALRRDTVPPPSPSPLARLLQAFPALPPARVAVCIFAVSLSLPLPLVCSDLYMPFYLLPVHLHANSPSQPLVSLNPTPIRPFCREL